MIQDIGLNRLKNHYDPAIRPTADSRIAYFRGRKLLCQLGEGDELTLPTCAQLGAAAEGSIYIFSIDETTYFLCRAEEVPEPEGFTYEDIAVFRRARPRETAFAAVTAFHLATWYGDNQFCGRCGTKTEHDSVERMMRCPKCGNMIFPKIMPSVIVAVTHGDKLLLTKYANRPGATRFALIAGFTEIGETVEETVHREVMEEVGLRVRNLRYYKSQPWGISGGGLLMGFWCEVDGDDAIHVDHVELDEGAWVSREELRETYHDTGISLTGEMITKFALGEEKA
jgi:NAD+ diphosphatase